MEKVGELCEIQGEIKMEWKVKNFFPVLYKTEKKYRSPKFYFSGASWVIDIYPNGQIKNASNGWVSLYLIRMSSGSVAHLDISFSIEAEENIQYAARTYSYEFDKKGIGSGCAKFILSTELMEKKFSLSASNDLLVICSLKNCQRNAVDGSLFSRLQNLSDNIEDLYLKSKKSDFQVIVNERRITAHRAILETRSPVFSAMLNNDTKENKTGEVSVNDVDVETMHNILLYIYSGDINELTTENVLSLYAAAEKYDLKDVKEICSGFIQRNLTVGWVCDVIKFSDLYQDETIGNHCREYFKQHAKEILETNNWKKFSKGNLDISVELLGTVIKTIVK